MHDLKQKVPNEVQVVAERYCKKRDTTQVYTCIYFYIIFQGRKLMHFTVEIIATYESSKPLKFCSYNMALEP